jgi:hypothetical protein
LILYFRLCSEGVSDEGLPALTSQAALTLFVAEVLLARCCRLHLRIARNVCRLFN